MSEEAKKEIPPSWFKRAGGRIKTAGKVLFFGYVAIQVGTFTYFVAQGYARKKLLEYIHDDAILRWKFDDVILPFRAEIRLNDRAGSYRRDQERKRFFRGFIREQTKDHDVP